MTKYVKREDVAKIILTMIGQAAGEHPYYQHSMAVAFDALHDLPTVECDD